MKIINKLKEKKGMNVLWVIVIIIVAMLLLMFITQFIKLLTLTSNVQAMCQQAVTDTATNNAYNIYNGVREGNTAALTPTESGTWNDSAITANVVGNLTQLLNLNGSLENYNGKLAQFKLANVSVAYTGASKKADNNVCLNFTTTLNLLIPLRFGRDLPITTVIIPMRIKSTYMPLF